MWLFSSCTVAPTTPPESASRAETTEPSMPADMPPSIPTGPVTAPGRALEEIVERGSGQFLNRNPPRTRSDIVDGEIDLRFIDADIQEFVDVILGDILKVNYAVDPDLSGTVTINTTVPISETELLPLFDELLALNDAALVRSSGLYRVVSLNAAARSALPLSFGERGDDSGYSTQVIPLSFIAAGEMQALLEKVISPQTDVRIDSARNLIIASGSPAEIAAIRETVSIFDVDWLRGMSIGLYPLDNVPPGTLEQELIDVLNATTGGVTEEILGGIVRLVPLDRLSSLLVVSSTPMALREIEIWIRRLDRPGETIGRQLYVYPMENAKASDLAEILSEIFRSRSDRANRASTDPTAGSAAPQTGRLAPGLTPARIGGDTQDALQRSPSETAAPPQTTGAAGGAIELAGNESIEIIADDVRNSLVILATAQDYRMVEAALEKLDVVPLQVLIEASILEVSLRDDLSFGVEWFFRNEINGNENTGTGALDLGSAGIAALAPGFSYSVVNNADQVRLALNALATESELNVLSSPSLMVLDNQTATINVGDEIPVPTRQSIGNLDASSPTVNEISFRQTGVTLSVTPRVSNSGLVTMDILQEVSTAASTTTSNIDAPTIQNRQIESVVAINSGETIVLGGLMQNQQSNGKSGVPGLSRIPGIGRLFGRKVDGSSRTELLVLITPRVVRNADDARRVTEEFREKLPQLRMLGTRDAASVETQSL
jgi:general secretion pathway protein D